MELLFLEESWLEHIATSSIWYVDGTFAIAPHLFYQAYIIMVKKHAGVYPVLYALLQKKQSVTYMRMIELIKEMVPNARPDVFHRL